jgi:hypothetical protein
VLNAQLGAAQQDKAEIKKRLDKLEGYSQGGRANVQQVGARAQARGRKRVWPGVFC